MSIERKSFDELQKITKWFDKNSTLCRIIDSINDAIWSSSKDKLKFYFLSSAMEKICGYSVEEFSNQEGLWLKIIYSEDREKVQNYLKILYQEGFVKFEYRIIHRCGLIRWVREKIWLSKMSDGNFIQLDGISSDITDQKIILEKLENFNIAMEQKNIEFKKINEKLKDEIKAHQKDEIDLKTSENRLKLAFEGANEGLWDWHLISGEAYFSPRFYTLLDYEPFELPASYKTWEKLIHPDDLWPAIKKIKEHIDNKENGYEIEYRMRTKIGTWKWFLSRGKVVETDPEGTPIRMIGTQSDISVQKNIEEELLKAKAVAELANKAKSEFLANMSHEIRNPINGFTGFLELLAKTQLDKEQTEYLREIQNASQALLAIVNDILDLSKIEAGKVELEKIDFNLQSLVEDVAVMFAAGRKKDEIEINSFINSGVPAVVNGDPLKLRQIFTNLINNAIKFTEKGEINLSVDLLSEDVSGYVLKFSVSDTGIGIPEKKIPQIFSEFIQADNSTTRKYGGTGLGLSITKKLVNLMGGKIYVTSAVGAGSVFTAELPLKHGLSLSGDTDKYNLSEVNIAGAVCNKTTKDILKTYINEYGGSIKYFTPVTEKTAEEFISKIFDGANNYNMFLLETCFFEKFKITPKQFMEMVSSKTRAKVVLLTSLIHRINDSEIKKVKIAAQILKPIRKTNIIKTLHLVMDGKDVDLINDSETVSLEIHSNQITIGSKILLAEDNMVNQKLTVTILEKVGIICDVAENGILALKKYKKQNYDLILMDCQMPEMNGFEAANEIRKLEGGVKRIPIIAMTANAMPGERERCIASGMDDYISKPFKTEELILLINKWLLLRNNSL